MKVLVTGATGFIGSHVVEQLLQSGVDIVASATAAASAAEKDWYPRVQFVAHRIGEEAQDENLFEKFGRPDALIHLAWSGLPHYKKLFHFEEVLPAQCRFLKNLIAGGLSDVTVTGTCFEYGMQEGRLSEDMPPQPANPYALAKDSLRRYLQAVDAIYPLSLKWVRLFYTWGTGQSPTAILPQLQQALERGDQEFNMSGGQQVRDYLPVTTVARNIVSIATQKKVTGIINCSSNQPITVQELVENFLLKTKSSIRLNLGHYSYPDYEPFRFWGDNSRLNSILQDTI